MRVVVCVCVREREREQEGVKEGEAVCRKSERVVRDETKELYAIKLQSGGWVEAQDAWFSMLAACRERAGESDERETDGEADR